MSTAPYQSLIPLFNLKSAVDRIEDFHSQINIIFHDIESKYYDSIHIEMWENLQDQFDLLLTPISQEIGTEFSGLSMLDIGCGTGLSTEMLMKTALGKEIKTIALLDTSFEMLKKAEDRIKMWNRPIITFNTEITHIDQTFDVIVICSVIHHIPDLSSFFRAVEKCLRPNGILITMHDPYAEAIESTTFKERGIEYDDVQRKLNSYLPRKIVNRLKRKFNTFLKTKDPIYEVNQLLLQNEIIKVPLTHTEIWSVTDIHVEGLPYSNQRGVSLNVLKGILDSLIFKQLITYCFYGQLKSNLTDTYREKESNLSKVGDRFGRNFGSLWIKKKSDQTDIKKF